MGGFKCNTPGNSYFKISKEISWDYHQPTSPANLEKPIWWVRYRTNKGSKPIDWLNNLGWRYSITEQPSNKDSSVRTMGYLQVLISTMHGCARPFRTIVTYPDRPRRQCFISASGSKGLYSASKELTTLNFRQSYRSLGQKHMETNAKTTSKQQTVQNGIRSHLSRSSAGLRVDFFWGCFNVLPPRFPLPIPHSTEILWM